MPAQPKTKADHLDREILTLLAQGYRFDEIALKVKMSPFGVRHRMDGVRAIYSARTLAQLIFLAIQKDLIKCPTALTQSLDESFPNLKNTLPG